MWFNEDCIILCPEFKVIDHSAGLVLIGADVLRATRNAADQWVYRSIGAESKHPGATPKGFLEFLKGNDRKQIELVCALEVGSARIIKRLE